MFEFNPYAIPPFLTSVITLFLGLFVYRRNPNADLSKAFLLWSLSLFGWLFSYSLNYFSKDPHSALFFIRLGSYLSIFIPINQYNLNLKFVNKKDEGRFIPTSLFIALVLGPFMLLSDQFLHGPRPFFFGFYGIAGPYYIYFIALFLIFSFQSFRLLWRSLKDPARDESSKIQIRYLLISFFIAYLGSVDFLPKYGLAIYPAGWAFILTWILIISYLMVNQQIFNFKIILEKSIIYSLLLTSISIVYLVVVVVLGNILQHFLEYSSVFLNLFLAFMIGILVVPLRNRLQYVLERTLFKGTSPEMARENEFLRHEVTDKEKFKEVALIASSLVHEVKNAITPVKTFLEFFPQKKDDPEFIEKFRRIATKELERTEALTRQLLDFAKPSAPVLTQVNIHELLTDTLVLVERSIQRNGISLKKNFSSDGVLLDLDPQQMKQAFLNILKNAVEVMPKGGTLKIETTDQGLKTKTFTISIEDTGPGIAPEDIKHLFEPFYSKKQGGTGLGLAITNDIIERHGGKIKIESKLGEGTRFMVELPLR